MSDVLSVRPMEERDIELLADYWLKSNDDHMSGMGVDLNKLPKREDLVDNIRTQINAPLQDKKSYALIWEHDGKQIGHSNVNNITFAKQANMHLHIWNSSFRKKGMGKELVKKSLPFYFNDLQLDLLICEPYALNEAPNMTLQKVGFKFVRKHKTIPGTFCFEQEVNRWEMRKEDLAFD